MPFRIVTAVFIYSLSAFCALFAQQPADSIIDTLSPVSVAIDSEFVHVDSSHFDSSHIKTSDNSKISAEHVSENNSPDNKVYYLKKLTVTTGRVKYSPSKVTLSAKDFSGKYNDLQSVLETVSGVRICNTGGFGHYADASIRGCSPSQVQFFLDGVPLNGATGGAVDVAKIPFSALQSISIYKSTPSIDVFGDNAGGVINLTTETNRDMVNGSFEIGSFGYREGSAILSKTAGRMMHRLAVDYRWADNDYPYTDIIITRGPTVAADNMQKIMDNNFYSALSSMYSNTYVINDQAQLISQFSSTVTDEGIFYLPQAEANDGTIRNSKLSVLESFRAVIDSNVSILVTAKGKIENEQFLRMRPFYLGSGPFKHTVSQPYGSLDALIRINHNQYVSIATTASIGYYGYDYNNSLTPAGEIQPDYFRIVGKVGAEAKVTFWDNFSARVGGIVRLEIDSTNSSMTLFGPVAGGIVTKNGFPGGFSELRYQIMDCLGMSTSLQYSSRSPGFSEKFSQGANFSGNAGLRPETRVEYNLGMSFVNTSATISSSFFASSTKDKIVYTMTSHMFVPRNVSDVSGWGVEVDVSVTPFPWLSVVNSATYMQNIVHSDMYGSWNGMDQPLQPRFVDNLSVRATFKNIYFGHSARLVSEYFTDFDNLNLVSLAKPQLDASVGLLLGEHIDISYRIENYLDIHDYNFQRPLPGMTQYAVLKFKL